jgi:hypothetical protein
VIVFCSKCRAEFPPGHDVCPECGSKSIMVRNVTPSGMQYAVRKSKRTRLRGRREESRPGTLYSISFSDTVGLTDSLRGQVRHGERGVSKPHIEISNDVRWNHDRQQMERRTLYVDRENDHYKQEWFNLETGERVFWKEGKLSDPDMHGKSARRSKDE